MSIFEEEISENILGDPLNDNLDGYIASDAESGKENGDGGEGAVAVEPKKKKTIRNARPRLNAQTLKGQRGIHTIESYFKDITFAGKGHEKRDLDEVMRRLQHWGHRMYPNYNFGDVLTNIERLGRKKEIQVHMTRYRLGQLEGILTDNDLLEDFPNEDGVDDEPFDQFDALLGEQIAISKIIAPPSTPGFRHDTSDDDISIGNSVLTTPKFTDNAVSSTPSHNQHPPDPQTSSAAHDSIQINNSLATSQTPRLTSEQLAKMAENRRLAQERLKAKKLTTITEN